MLPTPSTSHVPYARVYEPAEDSFLLLDTLSSPSETAFLGSRFATPTPTPLALEIGPGSGVVLAFLTAHARTLLGRRDVVTLGIDINRFACRATAETHSRGAGHGHGTFLGAAQGDLAGAVRAHAVDVLVFNPPYVPTDELPAPPSPPSPPPAEMAPPGRDGDSPTTFAEDSRLLALSYAGGRDGMEVTARVVAALPRVLSARGCAYLLLCAGNKPEEVKAGIRGLEGAGRLWRAETVGTSGRQAGWEKLQIVRIWRDL
ncbi:hypothetical protein BT67DRAFT_387479 [Trichocladium antarcticum]|uniref:ERF1 methyltransferase catalytic subunit MTQ2 n=1 Tax=Trichocladium antarcticum TaxID=1450529 RepID=A0AAN6UFN5_9PEZI|nr:hypothetical protein BT67DRAFT_387479 [Trichocladium antarcticum]